mgnify:CR=1 FL=1
MQTTQPQSISESNSQPNSISGPPQSITSQSNDATSTLSADSEESNVQKAWNILQQPVKVNNMNALISYLNELGVTTAIELSFCEPEEILAMSKHLKTIPGKLFLKLLRD